MSDFEPRPKGTVMYGAFDAFSPAERALRVLKNAGYARAAFEADDARERANDEPAVLVVDAAAAGARRAAEILEEFGARIRFAAHAPVAIQTEPKIIIAQEPPVAETRSERKPRVRKRARQLMQKPVTAPNLPAPTVPFAWDNVIIVTRPIESVAADG